MNQIKILNRELNKSLKLKSGGNKMPRKFISLDLEDKTNKSKEDYDHKPKDIEEKKEEKLRNEESKSAKRGTGQRNVAVICKRCGTDNDLDARFCMNCGFPLNVEAKNEISPPVQRQQKSAEGVQKVIVTPTKSVGLSMILTILFGPLGMFYSTIWGGIVMGIVHLFILVFAIFTFGLGYILFFFTWPICVLWGALAASSYNKKLLAGERQY